MKKFRLHSLFLLALAFVVICAFSGCDLCQNDKNVEYTTYVVQDGDTIWEIADNYCDGVSDIREVINQIEKINNISNSTIYIGESLLVPIYSY